MHSTSHMPTQESQAFYIAVYELCQTIPEGRVTTYGHLALLAGAPANSRQVGTALKTLTTNPDHEFNTDNVPWWRVISSQGKVSLRGKDEMRLQQEKLEQEGVRVTQNGLERFNVRLSEFGWFEGDDE